MPVTRSTKVLQIDESSATMADDVVAVEEPIEIRLGDVPIAVLMRTPGADIQLIRGFAITEGIVVGPHELRQPLDLGEGRWELRLAEGVTVDPEQFRRNLYASSSCGVCGKASVDAVLVAARPLPDGPVVSRRLLATLPEAMRERQRGFSASGGLHAAALFDASGNVVVSHEDIGRHNAVDKVVGALDEWPPGDVILMVSGRISFEIAQKAAVAGIPVVCGVSAASSLAIELANDVGLTLAGFVRGGRCVVYAGAQRFGDA